MPEGNSSRTKTDYLGDVAAFHRAIGVAAPVGIAIRRPELRAALIREEAREAADALEAGDLIEAIDGLMDTLVVVFGTIEEMGFDPEPFWTEVHRTNMAKADGPVREDGKRLKPPGWTPPDIAGVLARVGLDAWGGPDTEVLA